MVGNLLQCLDAEQRNKRNGTNFYTMKILADDNFGVYTGVFGWYVGKQIGLLIHDPKIVEAMYSTKNKYFDKHPIIKELAFVLTGESILFAETTDNWKKSRKAISPAFYQGKLVKMMSLAREAMRKTH